MVPKSQTNSRKRLMSAGVWRIDDPSHPRGYRELCSPAVLRKRKVRLVESRINPECWLCGEVFTDYNDIELEHKKPKGMNGARRDDHWDNLALAHSRCNSEKGSRRISVDEAGQDEAQSHTAEITGRGQASGHSEGRRDPSLAGVEHPVEERNAAEE